MAVPHRPGRGKAVAERAQLQKGRLKKPRVMVSNRVTVAQNFHKQPGAGLPSAATESSSSHRHLPRHRQSFFEPQLSIKTYLFHQQVIKIAVYKPKITAQSGHVDSCLQTCFF